MQPVLVIVGGFLGAGKTTLLLDAAREARARGHSAGLITNDQGSELVDTMLLHASGFSTEEITGGCFCCRFSELLRSAERLLAQRCDVILAEAVGSCTDLAATILKPMRRYHGDRFRLAPLTVLVDSTRLATLRDPMLRYLFEKQIAEADLVLHRRDGGDFNAGEWLDKVLNGAGPASTRALEIDYDLYAQAEARLGWLNWQGDVRLRRALTPAAVVGPLLERIDRILTRDEVAIAHLKAFAQAATGYVKASVCRNGEEPSVEGRPDAPPARAHRLAINLRAQGAPEVLRAAVESATTALPGRLVTRHVEAFRPSPPQPEIRLVEDT